MDFDMALFRKFLAGAGLLMFGLYLFEEAIKSLGGRQLKRLLEKQTKTLFKAIWAGTRLSTLTTSSTFVSLLLVAFVGAGLLGLQNAIGVILGSNIGTTLNSLWVAYMGFGTFKIAAYALPLIGVGGVIHIITKREKRLDIAHIAIGVGLLFVGLDYMKGSVELIALGIDLTSFTNLRAFGVIGFSITMLLHSQAAMSVITLTALNAGVISIGPAFAIIIGANVGTTMTAMVASLGGSRPHKQVALAHFFQNLISASVGILLFQQFHWLCSDRLAVKLGYVGNSVLATARFNTIFNMVTIIPFVLFIRPFTLFIESITSRTGKEKHQFIIEGLKGIGTVHYTLGVQLHAILKDCRSLTSRLQHYVAALIDKDSCTAGLDDHSFSEEDCSKIYGYFKEDINFLYRSLLPLQESTLTAKDVHKLNQIQSYLELYTQIAHELRTIALHLTELSLSKNETFQVLYKDISGHIQSEMLHEAKDSDLYQLQRMFDPAFKVATQEHADIDTASLIATQQGISQAFLLYQKLRSLTSSSDPLL